MFKIFQFFSLFNIFLDPYTRPNITSVVIVTNGTINITWTQTGCANDFSYVYLLSPVSRNWSLVTTTAASFHVIDSMIFLPSSTYQFRVNTRYVLNNEVIISDDSNIYHFTFPGLSFDIFVCKIVCKFTMCIFPIQLHLFLLGFTSTILHFVQRFQLHSVI